MHKKYSCSKMSVSFSVAIEIYKHSALDEDVIVELVRIKYGTLEEIICCALSY